MAAGLENSNSAPSASAQQGWGSSLGFVLAAAGSAIGLGNLWGLTYRVALGGGMTFLVLLPGGRCGTGFSAVVGGVGAGAPYTTLAGTGHSGHGWSVLAVSGLALPPQQRPDPWILCCHYRLGGTGFTCSPGRPSSHRPGQRRCLLSPTEPGMGPRVWPMWSCWC